MSLVTCWEICFWRWRVSHPNDGLNSSFDAQRKLVTETMSLSWTGRAFHTRAAAAGNARSSRVDRDVERMTSVDVDVDRRRWRVSTSPDSRSVSTRYGGAVPWMQQCVGAHNRNLINSRTLSQWSSRRSDVTCFIITTVMFSFPQVGPRKRQTKAISRQSGGRFHNNLLFFQSHPEYSWMNWKRYFWRTRCFWR